MGIANPFDASYNPIVRFEASGIDCQFTTNIAVMPNLECGHPILAIAQNPTHLPHFSLMYVRQLLCGSQRENLPLPPKFVSDPQKLQFGDLTNRVTFPQTPSFLDASSIKEIIFLALTFATGSSSNESKTARKIWILSSWHTER